MLCLTGNTVGTSYSTELHTSTPASSHETINMCSDGKTIPPSYTTFFTVNRGIPVDSIKRKYTCKREVCDWRRSSHVREHQKYFHILQLGEKWTLVIEYVCILGHFGEIYWNIFKHSKVEFLCGMDSSYRFFSSCRPFASKKDDVSSIDLGEKRISFETFSRWARNDFCIGAPPRRTVLANHDS